MKPAKNLPTTYVREFSQWLIHASMYAYELSDINKIDQKVSINRKLKYNVNKIVPKLRSWNVVPRLREFVWVWLLAKVY